MRPRAAPLAAAELPPQPPPYGVHLDSLIDEEGNYNFGPFNSDNSDGYKTVDANQQSEADDKILTGPVSNILDMIGLNNLKKNRGITSFLGIKLEEGGSLREVVECHIKTNIFDFLVSTGHEQESVRELTLQECCQGLC